MSAKKTFGFLKRLVRETLEGDTSLTDEVKDASFKAVVNSGKKVIPATAEIVEDSHGSKEEAPVKEAEGRSEV